MKVYYQIKLCLHATCLRTLFTAPDARTSLGAARGRTGAALPAHNTKLPCAPRMASEVPSCEQDGPPGSEPAETSITPFAARHEPTTEPASQPRWPPTAAEAATLAAAYVANKAAWMRVLDGTPHVRLVHTDEVTYHLQQNAGVEVWRTALRCTGDDDHDAAALRDCVRRTVAAITAATPQCLFIEWEVHPCVSPRPDLMMRVFQEDCCSHIPGHNSTILAGEVATLAHALRDASMPKSAIELTRVRTAAQGRDYGVVYNEAYDVPTGSAWAEQVIGGMEAAGVRDADSDVWFHYVGYAEAGDSGSVSDGDCVAEGEGGRGDGAGAGAGEGSGGGSSARARGDRERVPATCLSVCLAAGVAGFEFSGTRPQFRRRGYAAAMRRFALAPLVAAGVRYYVSSARRITDGFLLRRGAVKVGSKRKVVVWARGAADSESEAAPMLAADGSSRAGRCGGSSDEGAMVGCDSESTP